MLRRMALGAVAWSFVAGTVAEAMWAYIPLDVRLAEADLVVKGTLRKETGVVQRDGRAYVVADLDVTEVLKGPRDVKQVSLAWTQPPKGPLFVADGPIAYRVGQDGIWILRYDPDHRVHLAEYPTDRQDAAQTKTIQARLAKLDKLAWTEPVQGLQLAVLVEQQDMRNAKPFVNGKPMKAIAQASAHVLLRNGSKSGLHVNQFHADRPLTIDFAGPDGKAIPLTLYSPPNATAPAPQPRPHDFVAIAPGQVRAFSYGFALGLLTKPGEHALTVTYRSQRDGKEVGFDDAWRGELVSAKTKFVTPPTP